MLRYQTIGEGSRQAVLIHGIMGSSRNVMTFAKMLTEHFPKWQLLLPDLRHHGESGYFEGPNEVKVCAQDVFELIQNLGLKIDMIIGHSFGGKVALALNELMPVKQVWVWDAEPGFKKPEGHTYDILKKLKHVPMPQPTRKALQDMLLALEIPRDIALWMTTNVRETDDGLVWKFDLNIIENLLISFAETAFTPRENTDFVRAERGSHMILVESKHVKILKNAGHWVHIDNPAGLLELMENSLA